MLYYSAVTGALPSKTMNRLPGENALKKIAQRGRRELPSHLLCWSSLKKIDRLYVGWTCFYTTTAPSTIITISHVKYFSRYSVHPNHICRCTVHYCTLRRCSVLYPSQLSQNVSTYNLKTAQLSQNVRKLSQNVPNL